MIELAIGALLGAAATTVVAVRRAQYEIDRAFERGRRRERGLAQSAPTSAIDEVPHFEIESVGGVPTLEQFQATMPAQAAVYPFSYSNEFSHSYGFEAVRCNDGRYLVFIRQQPSYGRRSTCLHETHRYGTGTAGFHICFAPGVEPWDLPDACRKSILWADCTSRYIAYGESFG